MKTGDLVRHRKRTEADCSGSERCVAIRIRFLLTQNGDFEVQSSLSETESLQQRTYRRGDPHRGLFESGDEDEGEVKSSAPECPYRQHEGELSLAKLLARRWRR